MCMQCLYRLFPWTLLSSLPRCPVSCESSPPWRFSSTPLILSMFSEMSFSLLAVTSSSDVCYIAQRMNSIFLRGISSKGVPEGCRGPFCGFRVRCSPMLRLRFTCSCLPL
ncbi:hypothetical protein TGARI_360620 [Toxoplasma gondii ARI]|uniref:Uncharacterized protein n=2 Tax=Toxoplasma gondii TaxID=5811 RepID=B9QCS7_TOXGV|nr:hypothetical protein TGVEG_360620 [Toxoplasma gondii VEG]KYF50187.1 hypothetical protein TGARI_360620 [Toxoplasma gondii ARI]